MSKVDLEKYRPATPEESSKLKEIGIDLVFRNERVLRHESELALAKSNLENAQLRLREERSQFQFTRNAAAALRMKLAGCDHDTEGIVLGEEDGTFFISRNPEDLRPKKKMISNPPDLKLVEGKSIEVTKTEGQKP